MTYEGRRTTQAIRTGAALLGAAMLAITVCPTAQAARRHTRSGHHARRTGGGYERSLAGITIGASPLVVNRKYGSPNEVLIEVLAVKFYPKTKTKPREVLETRNYFTRDPDPLWAHNTEVKKAEEQALNGGGAGGAGGFGGAIGGLSGGQLFQAHLGALRPGGMPMFQAPDEFGGGFGGPGGPGGFGGPGGAAGGQTQRKKLVEFIKLGGVRYVYYGQNAGTVDFTFSSAPHARTVQIHATGYRGNARTARGVTLGMKYSQLLRLYGYPEDHHDADKILQAHYDSSHHAVFQLYKSPGGYRVVGILIGQGTESYSPSLSAQQILDESGAKDSATNGPGGFGGPGGPR